VERQILSDCRRKHGIDFEAPFESGHKRAWMQAVESSNIVAPTTRTAKIGAEPFNSAPKVTSQLSRSATVDTLKLFVTSSITA
jgi:hypothetical protein